MFPAVSVSDKSNELNSIDGKDSDSFDLSLSMERFLTKSTLKILAKESLFNFLFLFSVVATSCFSSASVAGSPLTWRGCKLRVMVFKALGSVGQQHIVFCCCASWLLLFIHYLIVAFGPKQSSMLTGKHMRFSLDMSTRILP